MACHRDPALGEMYALIRSQGLLEGRLRALAHQVSDANLQQMPDFQQRVEVLRKLEYIAGDNTVQLKVSLAVSMHISLAFFCSIQQAYQFLHSPGKLRLSGDYLGCHFSPGTDPKACFPRGVQPQETSSNKQTKINW